jgi:ABC-type multidrug transport system fused ATPase/permease subunit
MFAMLQAHSGLTSFLRRPEVRRHLGVFLRPNLRRLIVVFVLTAVTTALPLSLPFVYRRVFEQLVTQPDPLPSVLRYAGVAALIGLASGAFNLVLARQSIRLGYELIADLQAALYDKFQRFPLAFFARANTGAVLNRLTNEVNAAENLLSSNAVAVASSILTLGGTVVVLAFVNPRLLVIFVLAVPSAFIIRHETRAALSRAYDSFQLSSQLNIRAEQRLNVAGATVVKLYGNPERELEEFVSTATRLRDILINIRVRMQSIDAVIATITAIAAAGALAGGGWLVTRGQLSVGTLVLLLFYVNIVQQPMATLATSRLDISRSLAAMERVFEVLEFEPGRSRRPPLPNGSAPAEPQIAKGIDFSSVSFTYPDPSTVIMQSLGHRTEPGDDLGFELHDIAFTVPAGTITALVGPTGSGKSTIASLAAGLYFADRGSVFIDGVALGSAKAATQQPAIAFVTQDAHLFHDTIRNNLTFGMGDVTDQELIAACRAAQIHERIHDLPSGYNTIAGERGTRLSGGERQRIAIARAILRRPSVVILDEATAHLDNVTEVALTRALTELFSDAARLVIAHRLSTVAAADEILVIEDGRIVERGGHESLLATPDGRYARLHEAYLAD